MGVAGVVAPPSLAAKPGEVSNAHAASGNNTNANLDACFGQDRSFYASQHFLGDTMDIKQSFPTDLGNVGDERAAWVAQYCAAQVPART